LFGIPSSSVFSPQGNSISRRHQANELGEALSPINLGTSRTVRAIIAGASHTCALLDHGMIKCWGTGAQGQIGSGSTAPLGGAAASSATATPPRAAMVRTRWVGRKRRWRARHR
jgi:hypothetical protein